MHSAIQFSCACKICHKLLITSLSACMRATTITIPSPSRTARCLSSFLPKGKKDSKRTFSSQRYCYCCVLLVLPSLQRFTLVNVPILLLSTSVLRNVFLSPYFPQCTHMNSLLLGTHTLAYIPKHTHASREQPKNVFVSFTRCRSL